jgi:hypothetical protein
MAQLQRVTHRFVEHIPSPLDDGVVYVSIAFGTVVHKCCCGCGDKVVTPLTPVDWAVTYNGQSISLYPSIGRWDAQCRSHYWIRNDRVIWSNQWPKGRVASLKQDESAIRSQFFGSSPERPHDKGDLPNPGQRDSQGGWIG